MEATCGGTAWPAKERDMVTSEAKDERRSSCAKEQPTHLGNPVAAQLMPAYGETRGEEGHVGNCHTPLEEHCPYDMVSPHKDETTQEICGSSQQSSMRESFEGAPHTLGEGPQDVLLTRQRPPHAKGERPDCIDHRI
jgi:hypothetical protein